MPKWLVEPTATEYGYFSISNIPFRGEENVSIDIECHNDLLRDLLLSNILILLGQGDWERARRVLRIAKIKEELYHRNMRNILKLADSQKEDRDCE